MRAGKWFCNDEQSWDGILTFDIGRVAARFKTDDIVGRGWLRLFLSLRRGPSWWPVPWPLGLARAPVVEEEEGQEEEEERQQQWASIGDSGEWLRPPGSALTHGWWQYSRATHLWQSKPSSQLQRTEMDIEW